MTYNVESLIIYTYKVWSKSIRPYLIFCELVFTPSTRIVTAHDRYLIVYLEGTFYKADHCAARALFSTEVQHCITSLESLPATFSSSWMMILINSGLLTSASEFSIYIYIWKIETFPYFLTLSWWKQKHVSVHNFEHCNRKY